MGENYTEQLVRQNATSQTKLKKMALIAGGVVLAAAMLVIPVLLVPTIVYAVIVASNWKRLNLEYEYLYYHGDIDIDVIKGMIKRKRMFSANVKNLEVLAPTGSRELQPYSELKAYDCSSNTGNKTYEMVFMKDDKKIRVIFEPNDTILQGMRMFAPRKVFL